MYTYFLKLVTLTINFLQSIAKIVRKSLVKVRQERMKSTKIGTITYLSRP